MPARRTRTSVALGSGLVSLLVAASAGGASAAPSAPARPGAARAGSPAAVELPGFYDGRQAVGTAGRTAAAERSARAGASAAVRTLRAGLGDQAVVDIDPLTSTPRQVARLDGLLTGPSTRPAATVVLDYVRAQGGVFRLTAGELAGLRLRRDYVDVAGTHHLSWVQTAGGVPVFGNGLQAAVTRSGALVNVLGSPVAGLRAPGGPGRPSRCPPPGRRCT